MSAEPVSAGPSFAARPPSVGWEFVPVDAAGAGVWVWFRPPAIPEGLSVTVPPESFGTSPPTLRTIATGCGVAFESVVGWSTHGHPVAPVASNDWDTPLAPPPPGGDPQLHLWIRSGAATVPAPAMPATAMPALAAEPADDGARAILARMDSDWQAILHYERQLASLNKQLTDMMSKLGSLNRDLTPDEKRLADRQDQNAWQDARRWLRDCAAKVSQCLKAQHIGDTSDAGRRHHFEHVHEAYVAKGLAFEGHESHARELEQHRKTLQTLQIQMGNALSRAQAEGENRARRVLAQINAKKSRGGKKRR